MNAPYVESALYAACARIEAVVAAVAQRLIDSLGTTGGSFANAAQRQAYSNAQFDLRRKLPTFTVVFSDTLRHKVLEAARPAKPRSLSLALADFESLSLVGEDEVDEQVAAEKLGARIGQSCEAELRELGNYVVALLGQEQQEPQRNPLRPELTGQALRRAVHATSEDKDIRTTLEQEFGRALPEALKPCYQQIAFDLQALGIRPTSLALRTVQGPGNDLPREVHRESSGYQTSGYNSSGYAVSARDIAQAEQVLNTLFGVALPTGRVAAGSGPTPSAADSRFAAPRSTHAAPNDAQMLDVLRRLSNLNLDAGGLRDASGASGASARATASGRLGSNHGGSSRSSVPQSLSTSAQITPLAGLMAVNVIRQHRDELMRASSGTLDHMVIDVVGALFDQVLSDKKVPPQVARQISRLQLPVLRAALKDVGFFSSRRHPVRRFVNRIASLAAAYEDLEQGPGKQFIEKVQALVQEIVEGDFDQMDLYESKLHAIEALIQEQGARDVGAQAPVAALIDNKSTQLRIQQRYMRDLTVRLQSVALPEFVRDFIAQVWSQVQVQAAASGDSHPFAERARLTARQLVMSLQPKGETQLRKAFLMQLPQLMKDLNEGLSLIRWPEEARREFFAKLLPLHAEALKTTPLTDFEQRQLKLHLDQVDKVGIPTADDLKTSARLDVPALPTQEAALTFSPEEAQQIGLVDESAVDWNGTVDIDIDIAGGPVAQAVPSGEASPPRSEAGMPEATATATPAFEASAVSADEAAGDEVDIVLDALATEGAVPTHGPQLIKHLQTGIAYRMHIEGRWQRVRLNWISPGRGFFVFTHGKAHEKTISMTARMITRLCETERFRAYEQAELLERATARARKQLAKLGAAGDTTKSGSLISQI